MSQEFLNYYNQELNYLRQQGAAFAKAHPRIASYLGLGYGEQEDPFVKQLLEGVAFLTGRIQHKIDESNSELSQSLLKLLYPHYNLPLPSMSIIQYELSENISGKHNIPAHKLLETKTTDGLNCIFRSCYPVNLFPISIENICFRKYGYIKPKYLTDKIKSCFNINLKSTSPDFDFSLISKDSLRFYINADTPYAYQLYELLITSVNHILVTTNEQSTSAIELNKGNINYVGFADDEYLLPYPPHSFNGYRLLTEFFAYPRKFLFFDISFTDTQICNKLQKNKSQELQLHFFFERDDVTLEKTVNKDFLKLNATPIINLFPHNGKPINFDQHKLNYHIVPEGNFNLEDIEVYSIKALSITSSKNSTINKCLPYFDKKHSRENETDCLYWSDIVKPTWEIGAYQTQGTETFIQLSTITKLQSNNDGAIILMPELLCTNRDRVKQLPFGGNEPVLCLQDRRDAAVSNINCLTGFTKPHYRSKDFTDIDLLTHLNLNQLFVDDPETTLAILKKTLRIYHYDKSHNITLINKGLSNATTRRIVVRHPQVLRQGFCQGLEVSLTLDENYFEENNAVLFSKILNVFFQKYCTVNSIISLKVISQQRGELIQWKPGFGKK